MNRISLEFLSTHGTLWLALAPVFVALAIWVYYRTLAPLERPTRTVLRLLRGLAFLLVLFALAEPVLTLVLPEPGKPGLAVLVDGSASMDLHASDRAIGSRAEEAAELARRIDEKLGDRFRLDWFRFDTRLTPEPDLPSPRSAGNTALGDVLGSIAERQGSRSVGGVVLLTDGANTVGSDPVGAARGAGVPIFPVLVGRTISPADARILQVRANPVAFSGEPTPIEVEIASSGLRGESIEVRVEDQGKILGSKPIVLGGGEEIEQAVRFEIRPTVAGSRRFEIRLVGPGDAIPENDLRSVAVRVLERKTRILVVEGRLDWDHAFLRRTLGADSTFGYHFFLCDRDGRWIPQKSGQPRPSGPGNLRDYAAVILGEVPPAALGGGFYGELARYVEQGGGLLVLGGRSGIGRLRGTPVERLLPVRLGGRVREERPIPVRLEAAGLTHPVTAIGERPAQAERIWSTLPPVWPSPDRLRANPDGSVLLSFVTRSSVEPALVTGFAGEGKVAMLAAHDFWRWAFLPRGADRSTSSAFGEFALRLVRWLSEPTIRDRFLAEPVHGVFQNGERTEFRARVWNDRYQPVSDARVTVRISAADSAAADRRERLLDLTPRGPEGHYGGETDPLSPGAYRFVAEARSGTGQALLGRLESQFWVDTNGGEYLRVRPDPGVLEQIARASGGEASDGERLGSLLSRLPDAIRRIGRVREIELWNHLFLFLSFVIVLSIEWILRRRRGLA